MQRCGSRAYHTRRTHHRALLRAYHGWWEGVQPASEPGAAAGT